MTAFQFRMPAGIPGNLTRVEHATVEPQLFDSANPCPAYGVPLKINAGGKIQPIGAGDLVASVYGLLVRPFPTSAGQDSLGTSTPPQIGGISDVLRRGYMMVLLSSGSAAAAKGGQVYIRTGNASGGKPIGGYEAAPDLGVTTAADGAGGGGSNTGNGTITLATATALAKAGVYVVKFLTATTYTVTGPDGVALPAGINGAYTNAALGFTITAGGAAFVAGDGFAITVGANTIAPPDFFFTGPADANGNIEVEFNI
jgi:hypothetical protein